jgi:hypothetical protein
METVTNIIVILIVAAVIGAICFYLYRQKKRGVTCIGCPYAEQCAKRHNGGCGGCHTVEKDNEIK